MRRAIPFLLLAVSGCAYYNGIYDAKSAARTADKQFARGESYAASQAYSISATAAETVLVRHPRTHWRPEALYLAARGFALGNECPRAMRRLDEYLALPNEPASRRERALVAKGACLITNNQLLPADTILTPLLESRDRDVRAQASFWAGRGAMLLGDIDRAQQLLARAPGSAAAWEFLNAALKRGDFAKAESLLVLRAQAGDWRSEVRTHVVTLWSAGRKQGATQIVDLYGRSGANTDDRVQLRFALSDLAAAAGDTALARLEAIEAQRAGTITTDAAAAARLLALRLREFDAMPDIQAAVARDSLRAAGPILRRIRDNLTIINMLMANPDIAGAHIFLAAEIARDSLHAYRLAHSMFRLVERDYGDYEIAARALLAARAIVPESTQVYESRIKTKWDLSAAAFALNGMDPALSTQRNEELHLRQVWDVVNRQWNDTLKQRKLADSIAAAAAGRRQ